MTAIRCVGYALFILCMGCTDPHPKDFLRKGCLILPTGRLRVESRGDTRAMLNIRCTLDTNMEVAK